MRFEPNKTYKFSLAKAIENGLTPLGEKNIARYDGLVFKSLNISPDGSHADAREWWGINIEWCEKCR